MTTLAPYLLPLLGQKILNYAELVPITDKEDLLELKSLIESNYTDGISAIKNAGLDENDDIVGVFEDVISPRLTKKYRFTLTDTGLRYKMVNPADVDNFADAVEFTEQEYFNFARSKMFGGSKQKKDCPKGTRCGFSCIQKGLECDADKSPEEQKRIRALKTKARAEAKKAGIFVPKRQQMAEKKAKETAETKANQAAIVTTKTTTQKNTTRTSVAQEMNDTAVLKEVHKNTGKITLSNSDRATLKVREGKLAGNEESSISEMRAAGIRTADKQIEIDGFQTNRINSLRNGFPSREDWLNSKPKEYSRGIAPSGEEAIATIYAGERVTMKASAVKGKKGVNPVVVDFTVDGEHRRADNVTPPLQELKDGTKAWKEFEKSPVSKRLLVSYPSEGDGAFEMRVKMYEKYGFKMVSPKELAKFGMEYDPKRPTMILNNRQ